MKHGLALFFALLIALQSSFKLAILTHFYLNQDLISNTLCENKAKPSLNCKGKCYLKKQLKAQEQRENQVPNLLKKVADLPMQVLPLYSFQFNNSRPLERNKNYSEFLFQPYSTWIDSLLRPPRQA